MRWLGWMILAAGLPCWLMGFAVDRQVAEMISAVNSTATTAEGASRNVAWIQDTYWFGPYILWIGGALVVVGSLLGVIGLLLGDHSIDETNGHLHP